MTEPLMISRTCLRKARLRAFRLNARVPLDSRTRRFLGAAPGAAMDAGASFLDTVCRLVIVEHPILRRDEVDGGEGPDNDQQHPCHGGCVAHVELAEALLIEVKRE